MINKLTTVVMYSTFKYMLYGAEGEEIGRWNHRLELLIFVGIKKECARHLRDSYDPLLANPM